jgi:S-adenosylmethionine hydrolase
VEAFGELGAAELGLLADANGHLAVVARDRSAARLLDLRSGDEVRLVW